MKNLGFALSIEMKGPNENMPSTAAKFQYSPLMMEEDKNDEQTAAYEDGIVKVVEGRRRSTCTKSSCANCFADVRNKFIFVLSLVSVMALVIVLFAYIFPTINPQLTDQLHQKKKVPPTSQNCSFLTKSAEFGAALEQQKHGLVRLLLEDGQLDVNSTWTVIPQHYNQIWSNLLRTLDPLKLRSDGEETKYFIAFSPNARITTTPSNNQSTTPCTFITLDAERALTKMFPSCRLITADPASEINANLTRDIGGTFVHAAVGGETAAGQPANVWGEDVMVTRLAERKLLPQIGILDFLNKFFDRTAQQQQQNTSQQRQHNDAAVVDLLLVDIEGAEFGILEQLADHYDKFPVPICQLNVEVHDPNYLLANYTHQMFYRSLDRLLRQAHFALMHTDMYTGTAPLHLFLRMFFVNVEHDVCVRKFLCR